MISASEEPRGRRGVTLLEIVLAVALLSIAGVALVSQFQVGVRQTHNLRSRVAARGIAEWAIAQAQAVMVLGSVVPEDQVPLTADVQARFQDTAKMLRNLNVTRSIQPVTTGGKLYRITARVRWQDPNIATVRELTVQVLERSEI